MRERGEGAVCVCKRERKQLCACERGSSCVCVREKGGPVGCFFYRALLAKLLYATVEQTNC